MNSRLDFLRRLFRRNRTKNKSYRCLDTYLDSLCRPLRDLLPEEEQQEIREETRDHLESLIEEFRREDRSLETATEGALRAYGDPGMLGKAIARTWQGGRLWKRRRRAEGLVFLLISVFMFESGAWLSLGFCDPSADALPLTVRAIGFSLLSVLTGIAAALLLPTRCLPVILRAAAFWTLYGFLGGFALPPHSNSTEIAGFLLCVATPLCALSAALISRLRTRRPAVPRQPLDDPHIPAC